MTKSGLMRGVPLRAVVAVVAFTMTVYHLWTAVYGPPVREIHAPLHLCFALAVLFLTPPDLSALGPAQRFLARSYDMVVLAIAIFATAYLALRADHIATRMLYVTPLTPLEMVVSASMLYVILDAARRTIGWALVILAVAFVLYALFGNYLPGLLWHRGYSLNAIFEYSFFTPEGVYGVPVSVMANYVFHFVLFGSLLVASGAGDFFSNLANALTARMTGGPAKASVVSSAFMGMLSGSAAANVVTTGSFTIPAMRRAGYEPRFAAGVEAVSSSGGQIAPPILGTAAFIMMEFTGVSYATIVGISVIPAILYFLGVFIIVDLEARRLGLGVGAAIKTAPVLSILRRQGYLLGSVVVMLVILMDGWTPTTAAMGAIASLMMLLILFDKTQRTRVHRVFTEAALAAPKLVGPVTVACAVGGLLVGLIGLTGLGLRLSGLILDIASGNLLLILIMTMIMGVILGMGMPTSGAYIILAALLAPGLVDAGVPLLAAHMFLIYSAAKSSITPPVAIASYAAAAIAGSDPWRTSFTAFRLGLSVFIIPFMFAYGPALLGLGEPLDVAMAFVTACLGIGALSVTCVGWILQPISWPMRGLYFVAALLMINTAGASDQLGIALFAALLAFAFAMRQRALHTSD